MQLSALFRRNFTFLLLLYFYQQDAFSAGYSWIFSLNDHCPTSCQNSVDFPLAFETTDASTNVCSKKKLVGASFLPGYISDDKVQCQVNGLKNKVFQCLCVNDQHTLSWRKGEETLQDCQKSCEDHKLSVFRAEGSVEAICETKVHGKGLVGFNPQGSVQCFAGPFTSTISHCLCRDDA